MKLRYLILVLTTRCNLRCRYCYHGEQPKPAEMSREVIDAALALVGKHGRGFHLQLTGGEPTLVPELLTYAIQSARSLGRPCTIGVQTNGTRLTRDLARVFVAHEVQVGASLDGPPAIHEQVRGGASETLQGLALLEECGVPFRVTAVVGDHNCLALDRLVLLLGRYRQARGLGLDLLTRRGRAVLGGRPASRQDLARGIVAMVRALAVVNRERSWPLQLRELDKALVCRAGGSRLFCHACLGQSAAVHPDGRLYPCGQTLADPRFAAGTVWHPESESLAIEPGTFAPAEGCGDCPFLGNCPGDCPSRRVYNQEDEAARDLACLMYRSLLQASHVDGAGPSGEPADVR